MNYKEARERCDSWAYVPLKCEGGPIHPAGWTVADDIDYDAWYNRHLDAYIKHYYHVEPE